MAQGTLAGREPEHHREGLRQGAEASGGLRCQEQIPVWPPLCPNQGLSLSLSPMDIGTTPSWSSLPPAAPLPCLPPPPSLLAPLPPLDPAPRAIIYSASKVHCHHRDNWEMCPVTCSHFSLTENVALKSQRCNMLIENGGGRQERGVSRTNGKQTERRRKPGSV